MSMSLATRQAAPAVRLRRNPLSALVQRLLDWQERSFQRQDLWRLGDHELKDIGLSRADVEAEAGKPFWRT